MENKYKVLVWRSGGVYRTLSGIPHCSTGPASEYPKGYKEWWINGEPLTEKAFKESKWIDTE